MMAIGFEQSNADPCIFHKVDDGDVKMVVVVHVDDILAHAKDEATIERVAAELGNKFELKDVCETSLFGGVQPLKTGWAANPGREREDAQVPISGDRWGRSREW
ncbi:unnamed protein product [Ascophyllum nodosum]